MKQNSQILAPRRTGKAVNKFLLFLIGEAAFLTIGKSDPKSIFAIFGGVNLKAPDDFRFSGDFPAPFLEGDDPPFGQMMMVETEWVVVKWTLAYH